MCLEEEFIRLILEVGIGEDFLEVRSELAPEYRYEEKSKQSRGKFEQKPRSRKCTEY